MASSITLKPFLGTTESFPEFYQDLIVKATSASRLQGAILFQVLDPIQWADDGYAVRFPAIVAIPVGPGNLPAGATQTVIAVHALLDKKQSEYEQDYNNFMQALHTSLSPGVQEEISAQTGHSYESRTLQQICESLRTLYATYGRSDLTRITLELSKPYDPSLSPLNTLLMQHARTHRILAANQSAMPNSVKISTLQQALRPCKGYNAYMDWYDNAHPGIADQEYAAFVIGLKNCTPGEFLTVQSAGYQIAAVTPAALPTLQAQLDSLERALHHAGKRFCWSHGGGNHSSAECSNPKSGHVLTADFASPCGSVAPVFKGVPILPGTMKSGGTAPAPGKAKKK